MQNTLITEEVTQDCLLGADFLTENGCLIDLKTGSLHAGKHTVALRYQARPPCVCRVVLKDTVVVRPNAEMVLPAIVQRDGDNSTDFPGVFEVKDGFESKHQVLAARIVAR